MAYHSGVLVVFEFPVRRYYSTWGYQRKNDQKYECKTGKACGKIRAQNRESPWGNMSAKNTSAKSGKSVGKYEHKNYGMYMFSQFLESYMVEIFQILCAGNFFGFHVLGIFASTVWGCNARILDTRLW